MNKNSKIYVAGHTGLVGSALVRTLKKNSFNNLVLKTRSELDLENTKDTEKFFTIEKPEFVFLAAAKVGGILANSTYPANFIYQNLIIQNNVIHNAWKSGVKKLLFLGSSCIYPALAPQPIKEVYFLTGKLEPTNHAYAVAKIAGIEMCRSYRKQHGCNFICVMPTNLYGPNDNFDKESSHAFPAILRKIHEAKISKSKVTLWGSGRPRREFMYVDDMADATLFLMETYNSPEIINIGTGEDITIADFGDLVGKIIGYNAGIDWDPTKPDGMFRKLLDVSKINSLGWKHKTTLEVGIKLTYKWLLENNKLLR